MRACRCSRSGTSTACPAPGEPLPDEREMLGVALAGRDATAARAVWDELAAALAWPEIELAAGERAGMHPTRTLLVGDDGALGAIGEVDPGVLEAHGIEVRVAWLELDLDALLAMPRGERQYRPVSRFPSSDIDLAFVVDDAIPAAAVERTLREAAGDLLADLRLFDVYRGASIGDGCPQPGVLPTTPSTRPNAHRSRGRRGPPALHRRGRVCIRREAPRLMSPQRQHRES